MKYGFLQSFPSNALPRERYPFPYSPCAGGPSYRRQSALYKRSERERQDDVRPLLMTSCGLEERKSVAPAKKYFVVRRSAIAGLGAFAICDIKKGTKIVEYTGERISTAEAARRARRRKRVIFFEVSSRTLIDAAVGGGPAHRINHSCEGNCDTFRTAG